MFLDFGWRNPTSPCTFNIIHRPLSLNELKYIDTNYFFTLRKFFWFLNNFMFIFQHATKAFQHAAKVFLFNYVAINFQSTSLLYIYTLLYKPVLVGQCHRLYFFMSRNTIWRMETSETNPYNNLMMRRAGLSCFGWTSLPAPQNSLIHILYHRCLSECFEPCWCPSMEQLASDGNVSLIVAAVPCPPVL